uniref:Uncharacterized protein n=1 Tax=Lepeophtheirus salmonis TaxID=72036 RepID=A0A0K2UCC6_LEPSM
MFKIYNLECHIVSNAKKKHDFFCIYTKIYISKDEKIFNLTNFLCLNRFFGSNILQRFLTAN